MKKTKILIMIIMAALFTLLSGCAMNTDDNTTLDNPEDHWHRIASDEGIYMAYFTKANFTDYWVKFVAQYDITKSSETAQKLLDKYNNTTNTRDVSSYVNITTEYTYDFSRSDYDYWVYTYPHYSDSGINYILRVKITDKETLTEKDFYIYNSVPVSE